MKMKRILPPLLAIGLALLVLLPLYLQNRQTNVSITLLGQSAGETSLARALAVAYAIGLAIGLLATLVWYLQDRMRERRVKRQLERLLTKLDAVEGKVASMGKLPAGQDSFAYSEARPYPSTRSDGGNTRDEDEELPPIRPEIVDNDEDDWER